MNPEVFNFIIIKVNWITNNDSLIENNLSCDRNVLKKGIMKTEEGRLVAFEFILISIN
jgi:hypothetical protein